MTKPTPEQIMDGVDFSYRHPTRQCLGARHGEAMRKALADAGYEIAAKCDCCDGIGQIDPTSDAACPVCYGSGIVPLSQQDTAG